MKFYLNTHTKEIYTETQHDQMKEEYISENLRNMPLAQWSHDRLNSEDPYDEWTDETREMMRHDYVDEIIEYVTDKLSKKFEQDYCLLLSEKPVKVVRI